MTTTKIHATFLAAAFASAIFFSPIHAGENHPKAPTISVADISGHRLDLAAYRGQVVT